MRIVVAGGSGLIGSHLVPRLRAAGHDAVTLVRRDPLQATEIGWDPAAGRLPPDALAGADAVVNLSGAGIGDRRWNDAYRAVLRSSRIGPTTLLADGCRAHHVPVLLSASAVGYYGDTGTATVDESRPAGTGFLATLCADWEQAAGRAGDGTRVVLLRTGLVLAGDGGLLPRLARLTRALLGGRLGSGRQYFPWISITDHVAALVFLLDHDISGPVNLTGPAPVTNREFTAALGRALHRPAPWVVPGVALYAGLGGFAGEVLTGQRAIPARLTAAGFGFTHQTVDEALVTELAA